MLTRFSFSVWMPRIIVGILLWLIVEEPVYAWLGVNAFAYLAGKLSTEIFLYFMVFFVLMYRTLVSPVAYVVTRFDVLIAMFVLVAFLSTLWNGGQLLSGFFNVRTMLRYLAIYYLIGLSLWSPASNDLQKITNLVVIVGVLQSLLAIIQYIMGDGFTSAYFFPPTLYAELGDVKVSMELQKKIGASIGTFGRPSSMAYFLLIPAAISLIRSVWFGRFSFRWMFVYIIIIAGIFLSYKRGALLLALMLPVVMSCLGKKSCYVNKLLLIGGAFVIGAMLLVSLYQSNELHLNEKEVELSPVESLMKLGTAEYWGNTSNVSRGWFITEVGGAVLRQFTLIGYGADDENARRLLASSGSQFSNLVYYRAFDDVYLISSLIYYGPVGMALIVAAFFYLYQKGKVLSRSHDNHERLLGLLFCGIIILLPVALMLERVLELRAFSFAFWSLAGLCVVTERSRHCNMVRAESGQICDSRGQ